MKEKIFELKIPKENLIIAIWKLSFLRDVLIDTPAWLTHTPFLLTPNNKAGF